MKHYCLILGVLFLLLLPLHVSGQRVEMLCTQVHNADSITISWAGTAIASGYEYELYASDAINGPYTLLTTTLSTSYNHIHNAATQQWFYFVKAVPIPPANGMEYVSDTLGSIFFYCYDIGNKGVASLNWRRPSIPPLPSQDVEFIILRGTGGSLHPWAATDTVYYADTVHVCGEEIDYQIVLHDSRGCDNRSAIQSDFLTDFILPNIPQLDSVSINPITNETELGWNPSSSSDTYGYIIYIYKNGWHPIDTIFGADNTYYIDLMHDATENTQRYRIAAIDTCFNSSAMSEEHNTMITSTSHGICDSIMISWNAYNNMPDNVTGYRIFASENGGSFYIVDTVPGNRQNYTHIGINRFHSYVYYVQAYNLTNGYSASSAKIEESFNFAKISGDIWLRYVSVVENKDIEVAVYVNDTVQFDRLFLFRSKDNGISFAQIDEKSKANGVENYRFIDTKVDVQTETYLYTVSLIAVCNDPIAQSDTANNVVLKILESTSDMNEMEWTTYDGFDVRLDGYDIYRQLQTETNFQLITNLPASQTDYAEDVYGLADQGGKFLYKVAANEDYTNPYGFQDQSFSNTIELSKGPQSYIPNAFHPSSTIEVNRIFKPVLTYVDAKEYVFAIFDRWGNQVFYTNDITSGWDGTINGKPAAMGVYQYTLTYRLSETKMYSKQGHVTLIW